MDHFPFPLLTAIVPGTLRPNIPVGIGVRFGAGGLDEPGVVDGRKTGDKINEHAQATGGGFAEETAGILIGAVTGIDRTEVGHIVTGIAHRGAVEWVEPKGVGTEALDVIEFGGDAGQVTDTIAIGVEKSLGIDLVKNGGADPVRNGGKCTHKRSVTGMAVRVERGRGGRGGCRRRGLCPWWP